MRACVRAPSQPRPQCAAQRGFGEGIKSETSFVENTDEQGGRVRIVEILS